jgi:hypothetical protein
MHIHNVKVGPGINSIIRPIIALLYSNGTHTEFELSLSSVNVNVAD